MAVCDTGICVDSCNFMNANSETMNFNDSKPQITEFHPLICRLDASLKNDHRSQREIMISSRKRRMAAGRMEVKKRWPSLCWADRISKVQPETIHLRPAAAAKKRAASDRAGRVPRWHPPGVRATLWIDAPRPNDQSCLRARARARAALIYDRIRRVISNTFPIWR